MALRNRPEVFAVITHDAKLGSKRNVLAVDKPGDGKYVIRFASDRFIRPETHKITLTAIGNSRRALQLAEGTGGNQIEVHAYHGNDLRDASFFFAAERL
jgi:hypothetical protein